MITATFTQPELSVSFRTSSFDYALGTQIIRYETVVLFAGASAEVDEDTLIIHNLLN